MKEVPKIIKIECQEKYKLQVYFENGENGLLDLTQLRGKGVFNVWEDGDTFFQAYINPENDAITWPGDIDICPDNTYFLVKGISFEEFINQPEYATA
ncbi:MAG: DUF2442 domain-containing protein [Chitinophagaceae bacterium]